MGTNEIPVVKSAAIPETDAFVAKRNALIGMSLIMTLLSQFNFGSGWRLPDGTGFQWTPLALVPLRQLPAVLPNTPARQGSHHPDTPLGPGRLCVSVSRIAGSQIDRPRSSVVHRDDLHCHSSGDALRRIPASAANKSFAIAKGVLPSVAASRIACRKGTGGMPKRTDGDKSPYSRNVEIYGSIGNPAASVNRSNSARIAV